MRGENSMESYNMIPGFFAYSKTMIHGVSARNSSVRRNARGMEFDSDYQPMIALFDLNGYKYVAMFCNGMVPYPDYLTCWCNDGEELSEFEITRIGSNKVHVKLIIEKEGF